MDVIYNAPPPSEGRVSKYEEYFEAIKRAECGTWTLLNELPGDSAYKIRASLYDAARRGLLDSHGAIVKLKLSGRTRGGKHYLKVMKIEVA